MKNATFSVAAKIKPCTGKNVVEVEGRKLIVRLPTDETQTIEVDYVHDANKTQQCIYSTGHMSSLISKFIEGYNIAILTYGQTGSGKTFAFEGDKQHEGIIFKAINDIFERKDQSAIISCSFMQLYNEKITDMLSHEQDRCLRIRWQAEKEFTIEELIEKQCQSAEDMFREWSVGNKNRVIASNRINQYSSRSHSIFMIKINDQDEEGNSRQRQAAFVDLAGSERIFSPVGRLSKEAIDINKSLFFLRKVILALQEMNTQGKQQYIPYRDSKLTSILKKAFGACINPNQDYIEQTLSTLQYAVSARMIKNNAKVNIDARAREVKELREEKQRLKKELDMAVQQIQMFKSMERQEQVKRAANNEYANRIIECLGTVRELLKSNKILRGELEQQRSQKKKLALELEESEKNLRTAKKQANNSPVKESPFSRKTKLNTSYGESDMQGSRIYSGSVEVGRPKERGNTIIRRKKYTFHEGKK